MSTTKQQTNIVPGHGRVVVRRAKAQEESEGGIVLPEESKEEPCEGIILCVGHGTGLVDTDGLMLTSVHNAGDRIVWGKFTGTDVTIDGEDYTVLKAEEILLTIR